MAGEVTSLLDCLVAWLLDCYQPALPAAMVDSLQLVFISPSLLSPQSYVCPPAWLCGGARGGRHGGMNILVPPAWQLHSCGKWASGARKFSALANKEPPSPECRSNLQFLRSTFGDASVLAFGRSA